MNRGNGSTLCNGGMQAGMARMATFLSGRLGNRSRKLIDFMNSERTYKNKTKSVSITAPSCLPRLMLVAVFCDALVVQESRPKW
jgi:flagellar biosynthesis/type III secretory pathway ATPase